MEWNGLLEGLARFKFSVVVVFSLHSNRVSMASHTEKQYEKLMCGKIVQESMEGSCVRIGPGVDSAYALKQCSKHLPYTRLLQK